MSLQHAVPAPRLLGFLLAALRRMARCRPDWPKARHADGTARLDLSALSNERQLDLGFLDGRSARSGREQEW